MSEITELHEPFMRWLRDEGLPYTRSRSDKETTAQVGDPDFLIHSNHRCLMIEFKTKEKTSRLSGNQIRRHAELKAAGCHVHVCRCLQSAILLTREWRNAAPTRPVATSEAPETPIVTRMWMGALRSFRQHPNGSLTLITTQ